MQNVPICGTRPTCWKGLNFTAPFVFHIKGFFFMETHEKGCRVFIKKKSSMRVIILASMAIFLLYLILYDDDFYRIATNKTLGLAPAIWGVHVCLTGLIAEVFLKKVVIYNNKIFINNKEYIFKNLNKIDIVEHKYVYGVPCGFSSDLLSVYALFLFCIFPRGDFGNSGFQINRLFFKEEIQIGAQNCL
jgi:hypothetical protein